MQSHGTHSKTFLHRTRAGSTLALVAGLGGLVLLSGCRVGPKYVAPNMPAPPAYKESGADAYKNAPPGTWQPAAPGDAMLKGKWWEVFHEPDLNALEKQLDINNNNIARFFQNFMAARAIVRQSRAQLSPTLVVNPAYARTHSPGTLENAVTTSGGGTGTTTTTSSGRTSTVIQLPLDISWEPDLWGRVRNLIAANQASAQVSAADLENERLSEQASLAIYYFQLRGQDALQEVLNRAVDADRKQLELTRTLVETGIDSPESVAQAQVTLSSAEEQAAGVAQNRAIYEHAIATLVGKSASEFSMPVKPLTTQIPEIPIGVPSQVLERRPDIAAAERVMAQSNSLIGYYQAAFYPTLNLTGSGGLSSSHISSLFSLPALLWSAGSSAQQVLFDAGLRRATVDQYKAQYNANAAGYKQTVLIAFQQVEDYMASLRVTTIQQQKQKAAVEAAQRYADIANTRYKLGLDPYLNVISAETTLLNYQQTQVTLHVSSMVAAVQLVQALGGGWDRSQLPAGTVITTTSAENLVRHTP